MVLKLTLTAGGAVAETNAKKPVLLVQVSVKNTEGASNSRPLYS